jgi:hypothetical protein
MSQSQRTLFSLPIEITRSISVAWFEDSITYTVDGLDTGPNRGRTLTMGALCSYTVEPVDNQVGETK